MFKKKTRGFKRDYQRRGFNRPKQELGPRRNFMIRVPEVLLIDANNENVGVKPIQVAMDMAREAGQDLVEVGPTAKPPVCRIMDYAKYMYEQRKKQKVGKKSGKVKEMKEFRFSPVIEKNDVDTKVRRSKEYLSKGHNVRITMFRKGRQSEELASQTFAEILTNFEGYSTIEPGPKREGRSIFITFKSDGSPKNKKNRTEKIEENKPEGEQKG